MLDWKTKTVGVLLPAFLAMVVCFPAYGDDFGKPGSSKGPPAGISPVPVKLQTVLDANAACTATTTRFMPPNDSVPTPVNIDDGIPFVSAQVGTSTGDNFLLDTTSPFTVIFPSFARAHPDDVKDQGRAGR